jgi:hypothetical protein
MLMNKILPVFILLLSLSSCKKTEEQINNLPQLPAKTFSIYNVEIDGVKYNPYREISIQPTIRIYLNAKPDSNSFLKSLFVFDENSNKLNYSWNFLQADTVLEIKLNKTINWFARHTLSINYLFANTNGTSLGSNYNYAFITKLDTSDKFPRISDEQLLDEVQKTTFKYFWDFGHPVSGLARERNTSGEMVTIGGSGFGVMSIVVASSRNFISRQQAADRVEKIVEFLDTKAQKFHGAFSHWLNGTNGVVVPFSNRDNGADLVETSFLMQGLLIARQYFDGNSVQEEKIRTTINKLYHGVEWNWFRKNNEQTLYWHWSPNQSWAMNMQVKGWNEALITYVMAISDENDSIPASVYHNGWASNGNFKNGKSFYGYPLPLGENLGGPLFFTHYSFMGINPNQLSDAYADYWVQNKHHSLINYNYCVANPRNHAGYNYQCWGLTASDNNISGYNAHSPTNDLGIISPTAALSSMPYTPVESMRALRFFYYKMGDKIYKEYGFVDAMNFNTPWFANSFLAIDQGPIIVMIENYRSGLCWNLFMSCPEIKVGMKKCGFTSPFLN